MLSSLESSSGLFPQSREPFDFSGSLVSTLRSDSERGILIVYNAARFITLLFVGFDIISLLLQLVAAVLIAGTDPTDPDAKSKLNLGKTLGLVGVSTQIAGFGLFTVSAIRFHFAARRLSPDFAKDNQEKHGIVKKWQTLLIVVNVSCLLILVSQNFYLSMAQLLTTNRSVQSIVKLTSLVARMALLTRRSGSK